MKVHGLIDGPAEAAGVVVSKRKPLPVWALRSSWLMES